MTDTHETNYFLLQFPGSLESYAKKKTYFKIKEDNEELEVAYELEMILPNDSKKEQ